ncbi:diaminopimelate decarboxylase [Simiduia sp. 21SJ11W-1]|uniref:diaminopimelate decarboxylase n=1 Tax=Simiduia sp. 21SJ11W-1 TaxID=2909669 RepID=UPI00209FD34A|nr:diaminopimelate decarboxylase [Simiduia sp. 21SJ11W-1]UTA48408.1 diaminopimelate decarboxylase [Simiduia sp. 21SJ11W-1]
MFAVKYNPESQDRTALLLDIAKAHGSPTFVYDLDVISRNYRAYAEAMGEQHLICYAVKANANLDVLRHLVSLGSGFDIVSGGELMRVLRAGGDAGKVVFSGVGKTDQEIRFALGARIKCFNVESESELRRISMLAVEEGRVANISLRINPDVDAGTHPYISTGLKENKFGIPMEEARGLYALAGELHNLKVVGVDCHIGSQLTDLGPFNDALERVLALVDALQTDGIKLQHIDMGGGLGIAYNAERLPSKAAYIGIFRERIEALGMQLIIEPGRSLVAECGSLISEVICIKDTQGKRFVVADTAMNDNLRPALYGAEHRISVLQSQCREQPQLCDLVGPVCETADTLAKKIPLAVEEGDLLLMHDVGAYGFAMSSNYNARPRAAEVVIKGDEFSLARRRETFADMVACENMYWNQ